MKPESGETISQNSPGLILIRARTNAGQYSGGRLHAWILGEGFAGLGYEVVFWGEAPPIFIQDFTGYPGHSRIKFYSGSVPPPGPFKLVVVVPHMGRPTSFYSQALAVAARDSARVALLNFESGNWYNEFAPVPRDLRLWDGWRQVARSADVVLSSARESTRYARKFYTDTPPGCVFVEVSPAINSRMADEAKGQPGPQVICITRFTRDSSHKGGNDLLELLGPHFAGHTLVILVGSGGVDQDLESRLEAECRKYGAALRLLSQVSDQKKFTEIKKSRLLVFLSTFEGYGYPPLEALYCGVPCVAYDLPVLHEVGGAGIRFVPVGDKRALREAVAAELSGPPGTRDLQAIVAPTVGFEGFAANLGRVFRPILAAGRRSYSRFARFKWTAQYRGRRFFELMTDRALAFKRRLRRLVQIVRGRA